MMYIMDEGGEKHCRRVEPELMKLGSRHWVATTDDP
jgi:hypothetical protein